MASATEPNSTDPMKTEDPNEISELQLKTEITRILTTTNPNAPKNLVYYDFKTREYQLDPNTDQTAFHFVLEGNISIDETSELFVNYRPEVVISYVNTQDDIDNLDEKESITDEIEEGDSETPKQKPEKQQKLKNLFTVSDRQSQTYNSPTMDETTMTEPPPRKIFSANATQWVIYDAYQADFNNNRCTTQKPEEGFLSERQIKRTVVDETTEIEKISNATKIMERMVNQNTYDEIALDYKYYDDPSDEYRDNEGTLLPLWRFYYETPRRRAVTGLCWSPKYSDLFVVGYGSFNFMKNITGLVCYFSLKNPCYPEFVIETDSAVFCLDIHPTFNQLLCIGFYDGTVAVYNLLHKKPMPVYKSTATFGKHTEPVWSVKWQKSEKESNLSFFSISSDGRVTLWTLIKEGVGAFHESLKDLEFDDIINLQVLNKELRSIGNDDGQIVFGLGSSMAFHTKNEDLFLVGTEEGYVYACSKSLNSRFLEIIKAHELIVYNIAWNYFHPDIFITCSADWTVKIWNYRTCQNALFVYDLKAPVEDVAWAPYSSTVFAAVTSDGKVHVFDLSLDKIQALCVQTVVRKRKTKLTKLAFNPRFPIILVGDDRSYVKILKLSPNLRRPPKEKKTTADGKRSAQQEPEKDKMDAILEMVG